MAWKNPNIVIFSPVFSHSLSPTTPSSPQKNSGQFQPHLRKEEKSQTSLSSNNCHENLWLDSREKAYLFFQVTWPPLGKVSFASAWQRLGAHGHASASSPRALGQLQAVPSLARRDYQVRTWEMNRVNTVGTCRGCKTQTYRGSGAVNYSWNSLFFKYT